MGEYRLRCVSDGSVQPPYSLSCPRDSSLLRAEYKSRQLEIKELPGIWRFMDWLPVKGIIEEATCRPVTYRSRGLAKELGLENLYISFNGYWPEKGAGMPTCSFKDLEAPPTMQMLLERDDGSSLVVASAGNTARAFAHIASLTGQTLLLFVPEKALERMWTIVPPGRITLIAVKGDYLDAIQMAERVQSREGYTPEGGARNIARRDGMGTVMLDAAITLGRTPDHYFQAVGSGTGGISAWEASLRLRDDGRFRPELPLPRLHLAQNIPNAPIYYAWKGLEPESYQEEMFDDVLFNRRPPLDMPGGVRDALKATNGMVYGITDREANRARDLFEQSEEIDILNAPAVAVAALQKSIEEKSISSEEIVLLNITGGGMLRLKEDHPRHMLQPDVAVSSWEDAIAFLEEG
ncbi:MAG TPA: cysteate synthase [Methanothrix sp.]|uniref:cysteate synthase n=1 Tax=Methanothrix sp. TaxID=90426 RepID=UPI002C4122D7|nr:cysteate synthase [Methanothrix sp.]MDI9416511.1 cysteate synthase [Euryarchaeota archaeon]HON35899.1 cysteate synthase [Methanothrix sp.]HON36407.1 cysteate synthase [Methanothrix sp.]HRU75605.1 cysteate synthase [Methanothrix sp.]